MFFFPGCRIQLCLKPHCHVLIDITEVLGADMFILYEKDSLNMLGTLALLLQCKAIAANICDLLI